MAQWQQIQGEGWVQWADLRLADAWFARAQQLATVEIAGDIELQKSRTREAFAAIGYGCRALDTPPYNVPQIISAVRNRIGTHGFGTDLMSPDNFWTDGDAMPRPGDPSDRGGSEWKRECQRLYFAQRPVPSGSSTPAVEFKIRYMLDQVGNLVDTCASPMSACYSPQPYWMSDTGSSPRQIGSEADWDAWGFWDGGPFAWLAADNVGRVLPPVRWTMQMVKEIADQLVALGALEVLTQARLNAVLLNLAMANKHHLLGDSALARAATAVPAEIYAAANTDQTQSSKVAAQGIMALGAAIVSASVSSGNPYGFVAGAIVGAAGLALDLAPSSVGSEYTDMFGRPEPVYAMGSISGGAGGSADPHRLSVPDPPGYVPTRLVTLTAIILPPLGGADCRPPDDFYSAELRQVWIDTHPGCPEPPQHSPPGTWGPWVVGALLLGAAWKIFTG